MIPSIAVSTIAISFEGSEADRAALKELARRHKKSVGRIVTEALQQVYGDEWDKLKPFFAEEGVFIPKRTRRTGK